MLTLTSQETKVINESLSDGIDIEMAATYGMNVEGIDGLLEKLAKSADEEDNYITRMKYEIDELKDRFNKLVAFHETDTYKELQPSDKSLLHFQYCGMSSYLHALELRYHKAT